MKKKSLPYIFALAVFFLLITVSAGMIKPVYDRVNGRISMAVNSISELLIEKTGLTVRYSSFSPTILSSFYINDIQLYDAEGNLLLTADKSKVSYSLRKLLAFDGHINEIIGSILVDGVEVETGALVSVLKEKLASTDENKPAFDLQMIKTVIPQSVILKNIMVNYDESFFSAYAFFKKITLNYSSRKASFDLTSDGDLGLSFPILDDAISCVLNVEASVPETIENASVLMKISKLSGFGFVMNSLNLMAGYDGKRISAGTVQSVFPLNIEADYDLETGQASASVSAEQLTLAQAITVKKSFPMYDVIKDLVVTLNGSAAYNLKSQKLSYKSSGKVDRTVSTKKNTDKFGNLHGEYSVYGSEKSINLTSLKLNGRDFNVEGNLKYLFKNMQLSGLVEIPQFKLPGGGEVSTEIYFDPLDRGFMAFSPQVFLGEKALTAVQFSFMPASDSIDFRLEASDYSRIEDNDPGTIILDGSYLIESKYLQTSASVNAFYADSLAEFVLACMPPKNKDAFESAGSFLRPYMISCDGYFSTDLRSLSFNIPYVLIANTQSENLALMLSANGNEQSVQLNQFNLVAGGYNLNASCTLDRMPDSSDLFFTCDMTAMSIPYQFTGTFLPEVLSISGSYGFDFRLGFGKNKLDGYAVFDNLPLKLANTTLSLSADTTFTYSPQEGPELNFTRFEAEETGNLFVSNPKVMLAGNATKYGAQFRSISYSDKFSSLEGYADISLNLTGTKFDSAGIVLDLKNPLSDEHISMDGTFSNPDGLKFDLNSLKESLYVNSQIQLNQFSLNRFSSVKSDDNELTMSLFVTGTAEHPYVSLNMDKLSMIMSGSLLTASCSGIMEDRDVSINGISVSYNGMKFDDVSAEFSLDTFTGQAEILVGMNVMGMELNLPLSLKVSDSMLHPGRLMPDSFTVSLESKGMNGSFVRKPVDFSVALMYMNETFSLVSSDNIGAYGTYSKDGSLYASISSGNIFNAKIQGKVLQNDVDMKISGLNINLPELLNYFDYDGFIKVQSGILQGSISYTGTLDEPDFKGSVVLINPKAVLPTLIPDVISCDRTRILFSGNEIHVTDAKYYVRNKNRVNLGAVIYLNKWNLEHIDFNVKTFEKDLIPVTLSTPLFIATGDVRCDLAVLFEDNVCDVKGSMFCENAQLKSSLGMVTGNKDDEPAQEGGLNIRTDLTVQLGNHAMLNFDPLLRCVFVPNTVLGVAVDLNEKVYQIDGLLKIKSGDVSYLNRNFFIREGIVNFNPDELLNPLITVRAETREKDDSGQTVRIVMTSEKQRLLDFNPHFSSIPSKSENEIRALLGQIVIGDTSSGTDMLFVAGDYMLQSMAVRNVENKLREILNFDIFSVRTNVLQNSYSMSMTNTGLTMNPLGLLDNASLYIGKYFGNVVYLDAMLSVDSDFGYYNHDGGLLSGINLMPEFGVEFEFPTYNFSLGSTNLMSSTNLRWSMAPDVSALIQRQFIPNSSVTLSWKLSF